MAATQKYSQSTMQKAIGKFISGKTPTEISNELNVPRRTIRNWIVKHKEGGLDHIHHWILDSPNGPLSRGVCFCGKENYFPNSSDVNGHWTKQNGKRPDPNIKMALRTKKAKKK
ncbi:hypothetical protein CMI37_06015 [Candidatus Pacearchaeota archaeon]|nr:hypothetical protein [Candidatus Pacearchaeota archaeon]|tara:strand:+ start:2892 stop:3233 length:342 start_codon:yes stop_codon:yes gene_type:complete